MPQYPSKIISNASDVAGNAGFSYIYRMPSTGQAVPANAVDLHLWIADCTGTVTDVLAGMVTAPSSSGAYTVNVKKNGTTILGTNASFGITATGPISTYVGAAAATGVTAPILSTTTSVLQFVKGDIFTVTTTGTPGGSPTGGVVTLKARVDQGIY